MNIAEGNKKYFTKSLMDWHYIANQRALPWKQEKNPYKIWLSEIILQQTRAQQGLPYYLKFTKMFPRVRDLASALDEEVFRLWQGLGYYNRCKNMLATARLITNELNGDFPNTYDGLLKLKGIGPYTAAAIGSFAFGLPCAVVDGNVYRVLSRYFGIDTPYDSNEGKKEFQALALELLHPKDSSAHNQAIMDLGATVCTPASPLCDDCPLQAKCTAYKQQLISYLPVKSKKITIRKRYFNYILLYSNDTVWIHKRTDKDIWENLFQPYLIESAELLDSVQLKEQKEFELLNVNGNKLEYEGYLTQRLTHQLIETRFFSMHFKKQPKISLKDGKWVSVKELENFAFPKTIVSFLKKKLYF
ncbi:MAG TPA: A/G-specific adenine glycosylase [Flavipsychrobacter sp.]|nr:A/G-specific adenine glycosylase [Flavipsychrobacter sp.]